MLKKDNNSINRTLEVVARLLLPKGHAAGAPMSRLTHMTVAAIAGCLATSVPVLGEELEIPHTRVATAGKSGGFQCDSSPSIYSNPQIIQTSSCSLNTLTYTWGGRRVGLMDFDLSGIPEGADIDAAFVRLEGVCCYGQSEWFELIMMPGTGSFTLTVANQVHAATGEIVPHPPTIPDPGYGDYDVDLELMESIRAGTNWLLVGIDRSGSFTKLAASATLHVSYSLGPPCDGDLNNDDVVNGGDVSLVLGYWGTANEAYDLDGNGLIDGVDLAIVLGDRGVCPS